MKTAKNFCQKGATLMEVLGVLAIISIISMGALTGYNEIMSRFRASQGTKNVREIIKGVHNFCSIDRPCSITTEKAYSLGILTEKTYNEEEKIGMSPFSEAYFKLENATDTSGERVCQGCHYYLLSHTPIKPRFCEQILTSDWSDDVYGRLYALKISDSTFIYNPNNYQKECKKEQKCYELPTDLLNAHKLCQKLWEEREGTTSDFQMHWYFI